MGQLPVAPWVPPPSAHEGLEPDPFSASTEGHAMGPSLLTITFVAGRGAWHMDSWSLGLPPCATTNQ